MSWREPRESGTSISHHPKAIYHSVSASNVSIVKQEVLVVAAVFNIQVNQYKRLLYLIAFALEEVWLGLGFFPLSCVNIN